MQALLGSLALWIPVSSLVGNQQSSSWLERAVPLVAIQKMESLRLFQIGRSLDRRHPHVARDVYKVHKPTGLMG